MSRQGTVIDSLEFARQEAILEGVVSPADMVRLRDALFDTEGLVSFRVSGETDEQYRGYLVLSVDGSLHLRCQRCLGSLTYPVRICRRLALVKPGETWPDEDFEDETFDLVQAESSLDVLPLIEEEILLALPLAPRHDGCTSPEFGEKTGKVSPFAALEKLKRRQ